MNSTGVADASTDNRKRGWQLAAAGMLLVSTDTLFIRLSETSSWNMAFLVAIFALPVFLILAWKTDQRSNRVDLVAHRKPLLLVGSLGAVSQMAFIDAVNRTAVANVVTIVASAPLVAALVGWLVFGENTTARIWKAIAVTFVGILVVVAGSLGEPTLGGDMMAVLAILAFGVTINVWRRYPDMSVFVGLAMSSLAMLAVSAFFASPFSLDRRAYLSAIGMGLLFNPLGRICHASAPRYAPAAEVTLFVPIETVSAPIWAWLAFGEAPPGQTVIGAAIIIMGVLYGTALQGLQLKRFAALS